MNDDLVKIRPASQYKPIKALTLEDFAQEIATGP